MDWEAILLVIKLCKNYLTLDFKHARFTDHRVYSYKHYRQDLFRYADIIGKPVYSNVSKCGENWMPHNWHKLDKSSDGSVSALSLSQYKHSMSHFFLVLNTWQQTDEYSTGNRQGNKRAKRRFRSLFDNVKSNMNIVCVPDKYKWKTK